MNGFTLLAVFAHPDDEAVMMGGTLARYAREGVRVALLCATRGEWGPISAPALATPETLAQVREQELRAACAQLGVGWLRFLDCPDSGMNNLYWPEVEEKIVRAIRELRPQVIVTFGPDGLYGHDDHIAVGTLVTAAFTSAGQAECFTEHAAAGLLPHQAHKLYYAQMPQSVIDGLTGHLQTGQLWGFDAASFGVPDETITARIDVREDINTKLGALRCHRTQLAPDNVFALIDEDLARRVWAREHFRLAAARVATDEAEDDLFAGLSPFLEE